MEEAACYCNELRRHLIQTVSESGGHLASNLGIAEISMACLRVFNPPRDKIIYDVGHQSYVHKLLTGRFLDKDTLRTFGNYSGFTRRCESEFDPFGAGHSSTALSAAVGFAKSSRLRSDDALSIAVIGDGAFCTGMTFEALNNIHPDDKIIIVLNDNEMSISKNVGTMSEYLVKMRSTKKYLGFKRKTKRAFLKIPLIGNSLSKLAGKAKDAVKRLVVKNNFFEELGIKYLGPADGNDLAVVEMLMTEAISCQRPVLLHFMTKKGKGYAEAEKDPDLFHGVSPSQGGLKKTYATFSDAFGSYILASAQTDERVVAVTAAMCDGTGLSHFKKKYPDRLFDVGICEEHATTFSAAMNAGGMSPYFAVYSTFFQRCFDQLLHDVLLQELKITLALDRAGFTPQDGATHHGLFDVSLIMSAPGMTLYSPATFDELVFSFDEGKKLSSSVAVRYPKGGENEKIKAAFPTPCDFSLDEKGHAQVLIITYGRITAEVIGAKNFLASLGISCTILKFLKLKPLDIQKVNDIIEEVSPEYVFVVEEGIKASGFGEHIFASLPSSCNKCEVIAVDGVFVPHGTLLELYDFTGLSSRKISEKVLSWIQKK